MPVPSRTFETMTSDSGASRGDDGVLDGYRDRLPDTPGVHDESVAADGSPRRDYSAVLGRLGAIDRDEIHRRWSRAEDGLRELGVTLRSDEGERPYPIDLVPRILTAERWSEISAGLEQRVRALEAFLRDVYGPAEIVSAGVVDRSVLDRAPGFTDAGRAVPSDAVRAGFCGLDLVSPRPGEWIVLEDNLRMPGGVAMAETNRQVMRDHFPELLPDAGELLDPDEAFEELGAGLRACAPVDPDAPTDRSPAVVMVSPGPQDSTWYEQNVIAERIGAPLVTASQLLVADGRLWRVDDDGDRHRVDVLNPRMGEDDLLDAVGADGRPLRAGLLEVIADSGVRVVNAPGNGVADDKAVYALVPTMIEFYLGEKPLIGQVPTFLCSDPGQREQVLDRLGELVVKPIDGYGGTGIVVGHESSAEELEERRREIRQTPERFVAQEVVPLSTLPTIVDGDLIPCHVDLRAFVVQRPDGRGGTVARTAPTALTRVAPAGTMVVNVSSGGGGKDTWIRRG